MNEKKKKKNKKEVMGMSWKCGGDISWTLFI